MINKLVDKIKKQNAPVVVGLDPMMKFIPEHLKKAAFAEYGETLEGAAEAIWQFNKEIVDNTYDRNKINCPNFCDIIYFIHNIPKIRNINEWLVLSSNYFNAHSGKCFIIPNDSLDFNYLHSIDWKARQVLIHKKLLYTNNDILNYQETIRKLMIGTKLK